MEQERKKIVNLKRKLYHAILGMDASIWSDTEIEIAYQLSKDSDIQAILEQSLINKP